jgi:hypothetical protein
LKIFTPIQEKEYLYEINGILINKPRDIAEAFSKRFKSVYSSSCPGTFAFINQST